MTNQNQPTQKTITRRTLGTLTLAAAVAATLAGRSLVGPTVARGESPQRAENANKVENADRLESANIARVDELASAMKSVGKAVEPSVVSIDVEKRGPKQAGGLDEDMLKRMFPDNDGDGQPDLPRGLRGRLRQRGNNGNGNGNGNGDDNGGNGDADGNGPSDDNGPHVFGEGSGVILDATADKAYILTNNHVAGDAIKMRVTLWDGRKIEDVKVVGADPLSDLAVLEIKAEKLQSIRWGDSTKLEKGDIVLAFGAPFGYVGSMTQGIVSALNRQTNLLGQGSYENFIQTDCAINPGNSGGPLVNVHGELIGINSQIASSSGGFNGIGFAIPAELARYVYDELKASGKVTRGYLGVRIGDASALPKKQAERLGLGENPTGAFVSLAQNDSPAAGKLQPNDVIVKLNNQPVATVQELRLKIATNKPGSTVKLGVIRDGKPADVDVTLGTLPGSDKLASAGAPNKQAPAPTQLGATLSDANESRLKSLGLPGDAKGALVTGVKGGSPAEQAGLENGDLITKVGDKAVTNKDEAAAAIKGAKLGDGLNLIVQTKEGTKSVFVQIDGQ